MPAPKVATYAGLGEAVAPTSPTVARWELSLRLRERRTDLSINVKRIASELGFTRNYWSAVENDRTLLAMDKLEAIFDLFDFDEAERVELRDLREAARGRGWWMDYPLLDTEELRQVRDFFGLESGAERIQVFEGAVMHGLLQTEDYARAIMSNHPAISMLQVNQMVEIRMRRQQTIRGPAPAHLTVVLSEAAIHQEIGGRRVLADQLRHLLGQIEELSDTLDVRIMPFSATEGGILGTATLSMLDFPGPRLGRLIFHGSVGPMEQIEHESLRLQVELSYQHALDSCLDPSQSAQAIDERIKELSYG